MYTLRVLCGASEVYITRQLSNKKPALLQRLVILLQQSKYPFCGYKKKYRTEYQVTEAAGLHSYVAALVVFDVSLPLITLSAFVGTKAIQMYTM